MQLAGITFFTHKYCIDNIFVLLYPLFTARHQIVPMISNLKRILKKYPLITTLYREFRDKRAIQRKPHNCPLGFIFAGNGAMEMGLYEPNETRYLREQFACMDTVVNVGANYGYYALLARSAGKRVIAFEPHQQNYLVMLRNLELNNWHDVEAYPVALADSTGLLRIYGSGTGASLIPGWAGSQPAHYRLVPVTKLDRILGESLKGQRTIFIIDVEGAEYPALLGAQNQLLLDPAPIWFIEISISGLQPAGTVVNPHLMDTFQLFWGAGYTSHQLTDGLREITQETVEDWIQSPPQDFGGNFVFRKP